MSSPIVEALLAELDEDSLDRLADRLRSRLAQPADTHTRWLDVPGACELLACPPSRIYALKSAGRIPHHKEGSRLLFDRHELEQWVRDGGGKRP